MSTRIDRFSPATVCQISAISATYATRTSRKFHTHPALPPGLRMRAVSAEPAVGSTQCQDWAKVIRQPGGLAGPELCLDSRQLAAQLREHVVRRIDGYDCEPVRQQRGGELPPPRRRQTTPAAGVPSTSQVTA
jgi:hypothetical protein